MAKRKELRITGVSQKTLDNLKIESRRIGVSVAAVAKIELKRFNDTKLIEPSNYSEETTTRLMRYPKHTYKNLQNLAKRKLGITVNECVMIALDEFFEKYK